MAADPRVPVVLGQLAELRPRDALLIAGANPGVADEMGRAVARFSLAHGVACDCCGGGAQGAGVLAALFVAMMQGSIPRFDRVLAVLDQAGAARLAADLAENRILAARFRMDCNDGDRIR